MSQINTAEMQVNQSALLMDKITIIKVNDSEFILMMKDDQVKKGELPFHTDVKLVDKSSVLLAMLEIDHKNDWLSMALLEMVKEKILPKI